MTAAPLVTAAAESASPRFTRRDVLWFALLVAAAILVRLPFLSIPMNSDEGGYAYVARFWSTDYELYRDIPFDRPQAIFLLYRVAFALFGTDIVALRLFAAVYNALTVVAMTLLARRVLSRREGWLAGLVFAVFSTAPFIEGFTANAETFMTLPLVAAAYLTWTERWFWAGLAGAVAVLLKPSGISAPMLTALWVLVVRAPWTSLARLAVGFAVGLFPSVLHGLWIGWDHYWRSIHERRLILYTKETAGLAAQWSAMKTGIALTWSSWLFPAVAAIVGTLRLADRRRLFGLLWVGVSGVGVAMGGWWREHYFIQIVAPLAFLAGAGLSQPRGPARRTAWVATLGAAALLFLSVDGRLALESPRNASWTLYHRPGYLLQEEVTRYIASTTREDDTIFVAFAEAEYYYLAGRRAAAPQFYYLHAEYSAEVFRSVIDAIEAGKPALVAVLHSPPARQMSKAQFDAILARRYRFEKAFKLPRWPLGVKIYRRED